MSTGQRVISAARSTSCRVFTSIDFGLTCDDDYDIVTGRTLGADVGRMPECVELRHREQLAKRSCL